VPTEKEAAAFQTEKFLAGRDGWNPVKEMAGQGSEGKK
jgi:hypothetical protein